MPLLVSENYFSFLFLNNSNPKPPKAIADKIALVAIIDPPQPFFLAGLSGFSDVSESGSSGTTGSSETVT